MSRCTGHCCKAFFLPFTPAELTARGKVETLEDGEQILDMVIYVGPSEETFGALYSCKNQDLDTGDCVIYEERPRMCKNYPYGRVCIRLGCTAEPDPNAVGTQA